MAQPMMATAEELPPRPEEERTLPRGFQLTVAGGEAQCFQLIEWRDLGHLIVDYRALIRWAPRVEVLYAAAEVERSVAQAEAMVAKAAATAAAEREQSVRLQLADERRRSKRLAWVAGGGGVLLVIAGGVIVGVAVAH